MSVYSERDAQRIILLTSNDNGTTWVPATSLNGNGGGGGGGNGVTTEFVFDSNATPGDNVYDTWGDLYTELINTAGYKYVTIVGQQNLPIGTYDFSYVIFQGPNAGGAQAQLTIDDGVVITDWTAGGIDRGLQVIHDGTAPAIVLDDGGSHSLRIGEFSAILSATTEFISVEDGTTLALTLDTGSGLANNGSSEVIAIDDATVEIYAFAANQITDDVFKGDVGGGGISVFVLAPSTQIDLNRTDANLTGTASILRFNAAAYLAYDGSTSGLTSADVQSAIDEVAVSANVTYDPTASSLLATDVQGAIDELKALIDAI